MGYSSALCDRHVGSNTGEYINISINYDVKISEGSVALGYIHY